MSSQELLFCLGHCIVHCVKVMEELKMNRSEIFNFVLRRCLYFTWCNNLFLNDAKVLPEISVISLHIYHAIGPVRKQKLRGWYDSNLTVQIQFKSDDLSTCVPQYFTILVTGMQKCMLPFHVWDGKVRENVEALLSLFSKYELFVYGVELWIQKRQPDLFHVWFMWAWTSRYKRRASETVHII